MKVLSTALSLLAAYSLAVSAQKKPVQTMPFTVEGRGALATLDELWSMSDIVVEGIIGGSYAADYQLTRTTVVNTMYELNLSTVYKASADVRPGTPSVVLRRVGGTREFADRIEKSVPTNYPLFEAGERYILFLKRREWTPAPGVPYTGIYYTETTQGPDSVFRVLSAGLAAPGRSALTDQLQQMNVEAFRNQLRRLERGGGR